MEATTRIWPHALAVLCGAAALSAASATHATGHALPLPAGATTEHIELYGSTRRALRIGAATPLAVSSASIAPGVRLLTAIALADGGASGPLRFRVVREQAGIRTELYGRTVDPADPRDRRWIDVGVALDGPATDPGTLRFEVESTRPSATAALLVAEPAVIACDPAVPSVLVVSVGDLRAATPPLPGLARGSTGAIRFTNAFAGAPSGLLALQQLLTGSLFPESRTVPGLAGLIGGIAPEATRSVVGADPAAAAWLAGQEPGFAAVMPVPSDARAVTSAALRFLTAAGRCPTVLHVHYGATQEPGHASARHADLDRAIARLLRGVTHRARLDTTTIVVGGLPAASSADAAAPLRENALRIPLLIRASGMPPGRTVDVPVGTVDVLPTITAAGGGTVATTDGESLLPWMRGDASPLGERVVFARTESGAGGVPEHMARSATRKLVRRITDGTFTCTDPTTDPDGHRDLGTESPEARRLARALHSLQPRLAETGYQVRVQSSRAAPVTYVVTLTCSPARPLAAVDGLNLEPGDTVTWDPSSGVLTLRGTLEAHGEDRLRFDAPAPASQVAIAVELDGKRVPAETIRVGPETTAAIGTIALADPRLVGEPRRHGDPKAEAADVAVAFWHTATAELDADGAPPLDDEERERLRQLGYID